jgi:uncharacterized protein (TIGR02757 family)
MKNNSNNLSDIKAGLDMEISRRNSMSELSYDKPDPLMVASRYNDENIALICALFGYGNARQIVSFLDSLDFGLLGDREDDITQKLSKHYYRFQNSEDVSAIFIALNRLKDVGSIEDMVYEGYKKEENILDGLWHFIDTLRTVYPRQSRGYDFLIGKRPGNITGAGTYKRYMMYLRWMVRSDHLDMGLWEKIPPRALIMPLDTHTFHVSHRLGLLRRKTYDLKAAIELTQTLRLFDPDDPVKYDFAIYRLGQEGKA